jgi:hypothetical protein
MDLSACTLEKLHLPWQLIHVSVSEKRNPVEAHLFLPTAGFVSSFAANLERERGTSVREMSPEALRDLHRAGHLLKQRRVRR